MDEKMMSKTQQRVIKLITKPHPARSNHEIDIVLPWLKKKSDVMKNIEDHILKEIVRKCDCLKCGRDEVIIRQGDTGDCFFILLRGSVSVFISETKGGDEALDIGQRTLDEYDSKGKWQEIAETIVSDIKTKRNRKVNRKDFGKKIVTFPAGKAFGEVALMNEDSVRTASIISDEDCDLMVINRTVYNATLKHHLEREFAEKRDFIDSCVLFRDWNAKNKKLLERALSKECYAMDMPVIKQGQAMRGLLFIKRGNAKVLVEPEQHAKQYPHMYPFQTENDIYELENIKPKKRRTESSSADKASVVKKVVRDTDSSKTSKTRRSAPDIPRVRQVESTSTEQIRVKRKEGYAAAERRALHRSIVLCVVKDGACFGDLEAMQDLKTYSHTVVTLTYTEIFSLSVKNAERLINKRNPETLDLMEDMVTKKVLKRSTYIQGCHIPLVNHLVFKMTEEKKPVPRTAPDLRITSKSMPDRFTLFQHVMEEYLKDRAQLLETAVPGGVYYKAVMRQRADTRARHRRERHEARRRQLENELKSTMSHRRRKDDDDDEGDAEETKPDVGMIQPPEALTRKAEVPKPVLHHHPVIITADVDDSISASEKPSEAFLTEVAEKYSSMAATLTPKSTRRKTSRREDRDAMTLAHDKRPDMLRHQSFHTVCLVYDEDEHKSKVVHAGSHLPHQDSDTVLPSVLPAALAYPSDVPKTPSDAKMVGAPVHMDSRENSRQSSRRAHRAVVEIVTQKPTSARMIPLPPLNENRKPGAGAHNSSDNNDKNSWLDDVTIIAGNLQSPADAVNLPAVSKKSYRLAYTGGDADSAKMSDVMPQTVTSTDSLGPTTTAVVESDKKAAAKKRRSEKQQRKLELHEDLSLPKIEDCNEEDPEKTKEEQKED